jgi:hypothetical protein
MAEILDQLRAKYTDNEYMRDALEKYVQGIPDVMKTMEDEYTQKCDRLVTMNNDKSLFIEEFMSEHQYLYIPQTESFVESTMPSWQKMTSRTPSWEKSTKNAD